ncbi:MAG: hypothetical protein R3321_05195 [Nitrososphaeraceae archaeon]|nr:hypothetical protein [Nitrososphaeraceae archaeon]
MNKILLITFALVLGVTLLFFLNKPQQPAPPPEDDLGNEFYLEMTATCYEGGFICGQTLFMCEKGILEEQFCLDTEVTCVGLADYCTTGGLEEGSSDIN